METTKQATPAKTGQEQGADAVPQRKGGFVQGAAVAQGCCGETGSSGGCCGTAAQFIVPASAVQPTSQAGCCGVGAPKAETTTSSGGCC